ncbi:hypothetical protein JOC95_000423 [Bacillus tianshenii]|uniref:Nucleotide-diphospho-sugar transferase domain-containing protein n=1 Tax=Sutcliffiella tianshenii TaxID=1463404 RepID=A0ABS2NV90_9BACI|nr:hypothetical protein [Bacillus tianshenii]MBM7618581.1 hypothetical protein [Bacillus tianshenii]
MKILINYADKNFKKQQKKNTQTAKSVGNFDRVIEYGPESIDKNFYDKHADFITNSRKGNGYWLWKPYILYKTLMEEAAEGDYVFYCDSGSFFVNSVDLIIQELDKVNQDIFLTETPLIEYQWTKKECFIKLGCLNESYQYSNQVQAGFILVKKTSQSVKFISNYLDWCSDYSILNDEMNTNINKDLIAHRHDQSILSLLAKKENLMLFRDISQYGRRPWQYTSPGREYLIKSYNNSKYPSIVCLYRKSNWRKVFIKEKLKDILGAELRF